MQSPFDNPTSFSIYLEPMRNNLYKTYLNVITLSHMPQGPLSNMVKQISFDKLSPFQQPGSFYTGFNCAYALMRFPITSLSPSLKNPEAFMTADDIPAIFSYLQNNGYTIDHSLTHSIFHSDVSFPYTNTRMSGKRKLISIVHYNNTQL